MKSKTELQELRAKDKKVLFSELKESQKKLTELEFNASFRKLKNYHEITVLRKKIARIWTILTERSITELKSEGKETS